MTSRRRLEERFAFAFRAMHPHRLRRRPVLEALEGRALLATFTVNSLGDAASGSNDAGDLRYCINQANANNQANTIVFSSTVFSTPQTITLSGRQLELEDTGGTQTITGPAAGVTISGGGLSRVFQVDNGVTASISGLTISGGSISGVPTYAGPISPFYGGGLANYGTATLTNCTVSGNSAFTDTKTNAQYGYYYSFYGSGGGLFNSAPGNLTLTGCTVSGNSAGSGGGGLDNIGAANLIGCTVSGNSAGSGGGGLENTGTANLTDCTVSDSSGVGISNLAKLTLTDCTVSGNSGRENGGGGVFNYREGDLTLTDCTVSGNSGHFGGDGGGLLNNGTATLSDCALSGNSADFGGGLENEYGTATLTDCTVSGNSGAYGTAGGGGGLCISSGTVNLTDCTVSDNSGFDWGGGEFILGGTANFTDCTVSGNSDTIGVGGLYIANWGTNVLTDTIVAGNTNFGAPSDIGGSVKVSGSDNLIGTGGSGGLANGVNHNIVLTSLTSLGLAPLGNYGGPTQTMPLLPGSPAIGAGVIADYPGTTTPITTDQRGEPLDTPNPDIGAYQTQGRSTLIAPIFSGLSNPTITYGTSSVIVSGTLDDSSQAPVGESVAVTLDGIEQSAKIGSGGAFSTTFNTTGLTVANSPDTIAFAYTSDGTFASASTTSTLTVKPAPLTVTATNLSMTFGAAVPALTYTYTGLVNGNTSATFTGSLATTATSSSNVGTYGITEGTMAATGNYTIGAFTPGTLAITKANQQITWASPAAIVYGTPLGATQLDAKVSVVGPAPAGALTYSPASGTVLKAGAGQTLKVSVAGTTDFNPATYSVLITVEPAPLTVTATNLSMTKGGAVPALTYTYTGLVNGDKSASFTGKLATTATSKSPAGSYPITEGTLAASGNYTIGAFKAGTLTVKSATSTIKAISLSVTAGGAVPALTVTYTDLVNSDTNAAFTGGLPTPAVTVSDPRGYIGAPLAAMATVTGVNGTAARSLEGLAPTRTYCAGTGTSGRIGNALRPQLRRFSLASADTISYESTGGVCPKVVPGRDRPHVRPPTMTEHGKRITGSARFLALYSGRAPRPAAEARMTA